MAFPNGTQYWRVAFEAHMAGQQVVTTIHVKADPTTPLDPTPTAAELATDVDNWLGAAYAHMITLDGALDNIVVTEEVGPGGSAPHKAVKNVNRAGTRDNSGDQLPDAVCAWNSAKTDAAVKSGHGGFFSPPAVRRLNMTSGGVFDTGTTFWTTQDSFRDLLLAGVDFGPLGLNGHESYVIYSRTRRNRGDADWAFDVTSISRSTKLHWLRSRDE